jgi:nitronate monooxygenase/enoyl-[acyl-carrier protein] reductase II
VIRTVLCELLGIEHPIIQAGMGTWTSAELVAAVSNAGGLGSISTFLRPVEDFKRQLVSIQALTERHFAVNHVVPDLTERMELFDLGLQVRPRLVSFALADPGDLVDQAHEAGALAMHQVHTVDQAQRAAERGVDILVAQGTEAGGYGGTVATMVLVPQVVDAVRPIPVVAAGGIFDGRGLAAALVLGAVGVNVGTRFLASREAPLTDEYQRLITEAASEDAAKFDALNDFLPSPGTRGYGTVVRTIRTPFVDQWQAQRELARRDATRLREEFLTAVREGRVHELLPTAGQSAGGIHEVLPAAEIMRRMVSEAETALKRE